MACKMQCRVWCGTEGSDYDELQSLAETLTDKAKGVAVEVGIPYGVRMGHPAPGQDALPADQALVTLAAPTSTALDDLEQRFSEGVSSRSLNITQRLPVEDE